MGVIEQNVVFKADRTFAEELDQKDSLAGFKDQFHHPIQVDGKPFVYFCGNSLGLMPKKVKEYVDQELKDWKNLGVEGHFHAKRPWMPYHEFLTESMARVVGALPSETVVMNSLTVNLHLMMVSFYRPTKKRYKILTEYHPFPSDQYALESQLKFHGFDPKAGLIQLQPKPGSEIISTEEVISCIEKNKDELALVMIGGVNYYTGQAFDLDRITKVARQYEIAVGFDLAHGAGNINYKLHETAPDFAVWCSYKYLNSGPGGMAGCFVHQRHHQNFDLNRFAGWWGHDKETRFLMGPEFVPIPGAEGWQLSNPPILPMASLRASLDIFDQVGMDRLRSKSVLLTAYLEFLLTQLHHPHIKIITPHNQKDRGCQLSILVREGGKRLFDQLTHGGIIADWREPDVIRVAPVPLYNGFMDVWNFVNILEESLTDK